MAPIRWKGGRPIGEAKVRAFDRGLWRPVTSSWLVSSPTVTETVLQGPNPGAENKTLDTHTHGLVRVTPRTPPSVSTNSRPHPAQLPGDRPTARCPRRKGLVLLLSAITTVLILFALTDSSTLCMHKISVTTERSCTRAKEVVPFSRSIPPLSRPTLPSPAPALPAFHTTDATCPPARCSPTHTLALCRLLYSTRGAHSIPIFLAAPSPDHTPRHPLPPCTGSRELVLARQHRLLRTGRRSSSSAWSAGAGPGARSRRRGMRLCSNDRGTWQWKHRAQRQSVLAPSPLSALPPNGVGFGAGQTDYLIKGPVPRGHHRAIWT